MEFDYINEKDFNQITRNSLGDRIVYIHAACDVYFDKENYCFDLNVGLGIFWCNQNPNNCSIKVSTKRKTPFRASIDSAITAIEIAQQNQWRTLEIRTDCSYLINSMTRWINRWRRNDWRNFYGYPVKNKDYFLRLDQLIQKMDRVKWTQIDYNSKNFGYASACKFARNAANNL